MKKTTFHRPKWAVAQTWRETGLLENICEHGSGHPNEDWLRKLDPKHKTYLRVHGCDGCCSKGEE